jgi:Tfp pilus assembly protein FimT
VRRRRSGDRGSVTAELAVALPVLVLLLMFALGAIDAVVDRARCIDAARDAALIQARGGDGAAAARRSAPRGAAVAVSVGDGLVSARVWVPVRPLGPHLPGVTVEGTAVAAVEPAVSP